jgi:hypothetical protein
MGERRWGEEMGGKMERRIGRGMGKEAGWLLSYFGDIWLGDS